MNRILLDTHIVLWTLYDSKKLSKTAVKIMNTATNCFYYSQISLWEMMIKHVKAPDVFEYEIDEVINDCRNNGIHMLPLDNPSILEYGHIFKDNDVEDKDPFDRMLIAQASSNNMALLTHDRKMASCNHPCVKLI